MIIQPVCPCEHVWGAHKDGGRCQAQVLRPYYNRYGDRNGHEYVVCPCTKYHGPEIISAKEIFNPGVIAQ